MVQDAHDRVRDLRAGGSPDVPPSHSSRSARQGQEEEVASGDDAQLGSVAMQVRRLLLLCLWLSTNLGMADHVTQQYIMSQATKSSHGSSILSSDFSRARTSRSGGSTPPSSDGAYGGVEPRRSLVMIGAVMYKQQHAQFQIMDAASRTRTATSQVGVLTVRICKSVGESGGFERGDAYLWNLFSNSVRSRIPASEVYASAGPQ